MAEAKGFNLAKALGSVSKSDTERIERIDIDRLGDDPKNFYSLSDLDSLAENIELVGLQQPLRVRPDREAHGYYIIVSGHRRRAAIRKLVDDGREDLRQIPCIVEQPAESEAMQELRLIFANSGTRKLTDPEIAAQADRVQELLYRLKEEGYDFPGRMRDHVAEACQVSRSKLARLKVIEMGLRGEVNQLWHEGKINESAAYALARMSENIQHRILTVCRGKYPDGNTLERVVKAYKDGIRWGTDGGLTCPDGKDCTYANGFLRTFIDSPWRECDGSRCCITCRYGPRGDYNSCDRMCSKAKVVRKDMIEKERSKEKRAQEKRTTAAQRGTVPNARRVLRAIDAAGLADDVRIPWVYSNQFPVSVIRKWADGDFSEGWYDHYISPLLGVESLSCALDAAKLLKCSADYLLGLTDELHPTAAPAGYITDRDPDGPTEAMVLMDYGLNKPFRTTAEWDGQAWRSGGQVLPDKVLGWYPIPKTPDIPKSPASSVNPEIVERSLCCTGYSPSGYCGAAAACGEIYSCCSQCDEDCNSRCGWIPEEEKHE